MILNCIDFAQVAVSNLMTKMFFALLVEVRDKRYRKRDFFVKVPFCLYNDFQIKNIKRLLNKATSFIFLFCREYSRRLHCKAHKALTDGE